MSAPNGCNQQTLDDEIDAVAVRGDAGQCITHGMLGMILKRESLQPIEWRASIAAMERVHLILNELLKFVPANTQIIPDTKLSDAERADRTSRGERYQKKWLEAERARVTTLREKYNAERIDSRP